MYVLVFMIEGKSERFCKYLISAFAGIFGGPDFYTEYTVSVCEVSNFQKKMHIFTRNLAI